MNPQRKPSKVEYVFITLAPVLIAVAAVLLVMTIIGLGKTNYAVRTTSAYTRVSNCIVSKVANPPTSQVDVEQCYVQVEKQTKIPLERFDQQVNNENIKR